MEGIKVNINGNAFEMVFNLKVFRVLGKLWGFDDLPTTMQKVALMEKVGDGSFEAYDVMYEVLFQSLVCNQNNPVITKDDIENLSIDELLKLATEMTTGISASFPVPEDTDDDEKKPIAPKSKSLKPGTN